MLKPNKTAIVSVRAGVDCVCNLLKDIVFFEAAELGENNIIARLDLVPTRDRDKRDRLIRISK